MRCAGCNRDLEVGDRYIRATASEFVGAEASSETDDLIAQIMGGAGGQVAFCEDCTQEGGDFHIETYWGDDESPEVTHEGEYARNQREAIEHIETLPPSERSAVANRPGQTPPSTQPRTSGGDDAS